MTDRFKPAVQILTDYGYDSTKLIPILQKVQDAYHYLPEDVMRYIANELKISPAKVYGVATFFAHFSTTPKGKHIIKVCNGTACHVKGSASIINAVKTKLKLKDGQETTEDMMQELVDWFGTDLHVEKIGDGKIRARVICNKKAMHYWALQYGPYVEVIEPKEIRDKLRKDIQNMSEKYNK